MDDFWKAASESSGSGPLTEEEFFGAMKAAFRYPKPQSALPIHPETLRRAQEDAARLEEAAFQLDKERWRYERGWRRARLLKRLKLAKAYIRAREEADAMRRTFGHPAEVR